MFTNMETNVVSVERVKEYAEVQREVCKCFIVGFMPWDTLLGIPSVKSGLRFYRQFTEM
jgi:hypothetical protein